MKRVFSTGLACAAAVAFVVGSGSLVHADDAKQIANEPDAFGQAVSGEQLTNLRGGESTATNILLQEAENSIEGATNVTAGNITASDNAFSGSSLSVSIINTGNNAALQASAAITVNMGGQ